MIPENRWQIGDPLLLPGPQGAFDSVAVKDPSIVRFQGAWHVFYTARSEGEYTTGYVSAPTLSGLGSAPRHALAQIRGRTRYGCAPQVFFYEPRGAWYLVFQTLDAHYQPAFSTTTTIADPRSWSASTPLIDKDTPEKWIDFWVIADRTQAHLFYTQAHQGVMVRSTGLGAFPGGWGPARQVFEGVHEAVHIYKAKGRDEFHMVYELNEEGVRSFGLASAAHLLGPWRRVTDRYAAGDQLAYSGQAAPWTDMVSHGEALRLGCNQEMEYDPGACRWLVQGLLKEQAVGPYPSLPWKLGIMSRTSKAREMKPNAETELP